MARQPRYIEVEEPDTRALVGFLDAYTSVELTLDAGALRINVRAMHGKHASSWDDHEFVVDLPLIAETPADAGEGEE